MSTKPMNTGPALQVHQLRKSFGRGDTTVEAVKGIDLTVNHGEIVAFLGPNGAGKTTVLDMVLGLTTPDSGTVEVLGLSPRAAVSAGRVAAVLQTGGLLGDITVRETVHLVASLFPNPISTEAALDRADLTELADRRVSKCSGGEQQRLKFALALLPQPDLLILDEPTAGMDVSARRAFWNTMRAETSAGRTVIFATHYLEEADAFAERIVLISAGHIVAEGPTEEIRALAHGRDVSATLSEPTAETLLALRKAPGVQTTILQGDRITAQVSAAHSDDFARLLLNRYAANNLEITTGSLESAFLTLTTARSNQPPPGHPTQTPPGKEPLKEIVR